MMILTWNPKTTDVALHELLRTLADEYPLREDAQNVNLVFEKTEDPGVLRVTRRGDCWFVAYGPGAVAARGVAYAFSAQECSEKVFFKTYGILFDCTRGNIITVKHFKHWLRRLALLGYNMAMIYTKDAYQVPGEPYFGYMRGAYSMEEIREIDAYAKKLNIEMIASIQALGHLEPVLRWPVYNEIRDTSSVILVDEPQSYELLEKMIKFWSDALSSRRIHLGMDETHDLGRGKFMDRNGYESPFDIYNRHLGRLCKMCEKFKLKPIIWSDMYFRYANKDQNYYDTQSAVPENVKKAIPPMVQLSYWDYYHRDRETYEKMLARTRDLNGSAPLMASGVWTWQRFWTDYEMTYATVRPCIDVCRKTGVNELIFTLWGDDGGYCDFDSAFAALAWAADYACNEKENEDRTAKLFEAVCGSSYRLQMICGNSCYTYNGKLDRIVKITPGALLWDDPLMAIAWHEFPAMKPQLAETLLSGYRKIMELIEPHRDDQAAGHINYVWNLLNVLILKIELRQRLEHAYEKRDFNTLETIAERYIPDVLDAIDGLLEAFREQWKRSFKSYGMELMQIRLGGLSERYRELARVIDELVHGEIDSIPELEIKHQPRGYLPDSYLRTATGCFFI